MERRNEKIIDIQRLLKAVLGKLWAVVLSAVLGAVVFLLITVWAITPLYRSSAMFYVNNESFSLSGASFKITSSDILASQDLVESYIIILQARETLLEVIREAGVSRTVAELEDMMTVAAVEATEIFRVEVTGADPAEVQSIAEAVTLVLPRRIDSIMEGSAAKVVEAAVLPAKPFTPSRLVNTVTGFLFGISLSVTFLILAEVADSRIRNQEEAAKVSGRPVLTVVPDMTAATKGGYYGYGEKKNTPAPGKKTPPPLVGSGISFAAAEAYKRLRTNLQFAFPGEGCRVIGVSSAMAGEGKSLTAANLACSLAELRKRVLLIDCDMRRPTVSAKLPVKKTPGLSEYLSGQSNGSLTIQNCNLPERETLFRVLASGSNPPNPMELLSSPRMGELLTALREQFDYILLDLPPVGEVGDALAAAPLTDGFLLVTRQDYCDRYVLQDTVGQFAFVGANLLGVVFNYATEQGGAYGKGYRKYYASQKK